MTKVAPKLTVKGEQWMVFVWLNVAYLKVAKGNWLTTLKLIQVTVKYNFPAVRQLLLICLFHGAVLLLDNSNVISWLSVFSDCIDLIMHGRSVLVSISNSFISAKHLEVFKTGRQLERLNKQQLLINCCLIEKSIRKQDEVTNFGNEIPFSINS